MTVFTSIDPLFCFPVIIIERVYAQLAVATTLQNFIQKSGEKILDFCKPLSCCKNLLAEISDLKAGMPIRLCIIQAICILHDASGDISLLS